MNGGLQVTASNSRQSQPATTTMAAPTVPQPNHPARPIACCTKKESQPLGELAEVGIQRAHLAKVSATVSTDAAEQPFHPDKRQIDRKDRADPQGDRGAELQDSDGLQVGHDV